MNSNSGLYFLELFVPAGIIWGVEFLVLYSGGSNKFRPTQYYCAVFAEIQYKAYS
jgi:hypothetical protein